jgi:hypothetical protein
VTVLAAVLALSPPLSGAARAQTPDSPVPPAAAADDARELLRQGVALRKRGQDRAAYQIIKRAHEIHPTPLSSAQLGLVAQALGRWREADQHLREALAHGSDGYILKNRTVLESALREVDQQLVAVRLHLPSGGLPAGAQLTVNGRPVPLRAPGDTLELRVNPGRVDLRATAPGHQPWSRTGEAAAGQVVDERLQLSPLPSAPLAPASPVAAVPLAAAGGDEAAARARRLRIAAWATGGAAVAFLAMGIAGSVVRENQVKVFNSDSCLSATATRLENCRGAYDRANQAQAVEIAGYAISGALALTSAAMFLWPRLRPASRDAQGSPAVHVTRLDCGPGPGTVGLACQARF